MSQFVADTSILNGHLELNNIPFANNIHVKVIVIPKVELSQMAFPQMLMSRKKGMNDERI